MFTTLKELFIEICNSIRVVIGSTSSINHQDIPSKIDMIASEVNTQNALIEEINTMLENKAYSSLDISYNAETKTLTITEVL